MSYYRTCPICGAALDPGERCDCRSEGESRMSHESEKKAAPVFLHRGGGVETGLTAHISTSSLTKIKEDCKL